MKRLLPIIFSTLFFSSALTQDYYTNFSEYGPREGFNAYETGGNAIKDKKGFIWIGSDNGLYRFDGQNFKTFLHNPADTFSLPSDNVGTILIERDGTFWVANGINGISQFDRDTQKFHQWRNSNFTEIDISKENITNIFQDSNDRIWFIIAGKGLAYLNKKDNRLKIFSFYNDLIYPPKWMSTAYLTNIAEDRNHLFWISSNDGLVQFDPETKAFQVFRDTTHGKENVGRHAAINYVYTGDDGMIWTGTWGAGLKKFDPHKKTWETHCWDLEHLENSTTNIAFSILQKSAVELWVATFNGLFIFNTHTKQFTKVVSMHSSKDNTIIGMRLFDDGAGNIWCSGGKPLTKLETKNNLFRFQPVTDNPLYGSGLVFCNTFLDDPANGLLFIGTIHSKGLYIKDKKSGEITNYPVTKQKAYPVANQTRFPENIYQFLKDRDKNIWICFDNGMQLFDIRTKQFRSLSPSIKDAAFLNSAVYAALEDDDGSIWIASREKGLLRYDKKFKEVRIFLPGNNKLPGDYILTLFKDSRGNIWAGYHGKSGIACIDKNRTGIKFYNYANYRIPQADVWSINESAEGNIFFSLQMYGLGEITNPLTGKDAFKLYDKNNGLPGSKAMSIVKDKQNNLWISTNNGLSLCHTTGMNFQNFTVADGLRDNNSDAALYCDSSGMVYIGNANGFQTFNPEFLNSNKDIPPVILHSFKINGKEYDGDINAVNKISLGHNEANFSFEYAALTFTNNDRIKYAYRLKGLDNDWRFADKQRIAAYSIAHGGIYTLQIKATNEQGNWGEKPYELIINVSPPFWETWWFITLCVLSAVLLVFWFTRRRIKMIRAAEERKTYINKIKAEAEMKALRAQMNPHFIFNCMNTIDAYIHKNNTEAASGFLHKFSMLIRMVLENSQYAFISVEKDMEALKLYIELEEQRHDFRFTHELNLPQSFIQKKYKIAPLLIQPYVENAILHGLRHKENGGGLLKISFTEQQGQVICFVEDNGIGRVAAAAIYSHRGPHHQSLGLKVSEERIESQNAIGSPVSGVSITDKPGNGGTIVKLILPKIEESL